MRILIASDAWFPQINGVVRTLSTVADELTALGHVVTVVGPDRFPDRPDAELPGSAHRRRTQAGAWRA